MSCHQSIPHASCSSEELVSVQYNNFYKSSKRIDLSVDIDYHKPFTSGHPTVSYSIDTPIQENHLPSLSDLTWTQVKEYLKQDNRIILPLGATEEHGPHLGLGTDFIEAEAIAHNASEATGVITAPTLNYGMSLPMMGFPGTISLNPKTLISVIGDILRSLHHHGFQRILIVNGHGGNTASIESAVQSVPGLCVKLFEWWRDAEAYQVVIETMGKQKGSHASFGETALMLAIRPEAVKMKNLSGNDAPVKPSQDMTTAQTFAKLYPDGIMGLDPSKATAEAGELILKKSVEICVRELDWWGDRFLR